MGVSLSGVAAWSPDDQLQPGTYRMTAGATERANSSNGNPQVKVEWSVTLGQFKGAEQRDYITFTEKALGRVAQVIEAAGIPTPDHEFESYEAMADWFAGAIKGKQVDAIVRLEPSVKDPSKEWPTIKGYRKPSSSDIPGDPVGNGAPATADAKPLPF